MAAYRRWWLALWVKVLATKADDLSLTPRTHMMEFLLKTTGHLLVCHMYRHTYTHSN